MHFAVFPSVPGQFRAVRLKFVFICRAVLLNNFFLLFPASPGFSWLLLAPGSGLWALGGLRVLGFSRLLRASPGFSGLLWARPGSSGLLWASPGFSGLQAPGSGVPGSSLEAPGSGAGF